MFKKARRFANTFRSIDDLTVLNSGGELERSFRKIYPSELQLKKKSDINIGTSFLDLRIKVRDNRFSIVKMPYLRSSIPSNMFYSAFGAEIPRITRNTSTCNEFRTSSKVLLRGHAFMMFTRKEVGGGRGF